MVSASPTLSRDCMVPRYFVPNSGLIKRVKAPHRTTLCHFAAAAAVAARRGSQGCTRFRRCPAAANPAPPCCRPDTLHADSAAGNHPAASGPNRACMHSFKLWVPEVQRVQPPGRRTPRWASHHSSRGSSPPARLLRCAPGCGKVPYTAGSRAPARARGPRGGCGAGVPLRLLVGGCGFFVAQAVKPSRAWNGIRACRGGERARRGALAGRGVLRGRQPPPPPPPLPLSVGQTGTVNAARVQHPAPHSSAASSDSLALSLSLRCSSGGGRAAPQWSAPTSVARHSILLFAGWRKAGAAQEGMGLEGSTAVPLEPALAPQHGGGTSCWRRRRRRAAARFSRRDAWGGRCDAGLPAASAAGRRPRLPPSAAPTWSAGQLVPLTALAPSNRLLGAPPHRPVAAAYPPPTAGRLGGTHLIVGQLGLLPALGLCGLAAGLGLEGGVLADRLVHLPDTQNKGRTGGGGGAAVGAPARQHAAQPQNASCTRGEREETQAGAAGACRRSVAAGKIKTYLQRSTDSIPGSTHLGVHVLQVVGLHARLQVLAAAQKRVGEWVGGCSGGRAGGGEGRGGMRWSSTREGGREGGREAVGGAVRSGDGGTGGSWWQRATQQAAAAAPANPSCASPTRSTRFGGRPPRSTRRASRGPPPCAARTGRHSMHITACTACTAQHSHKVRGVLLRVLLLHLLHVLAHVAAVDVLAQDLRRSSSSRDGRDAAQPAGRRARRAAAASLLTQLATPWGGAAGWGRRCSGGAGGDLPSRSATTRRQGSRHPAPTSASNSLASGS